MKNMFFVLTLCAAVLLAGCNTGIPSPNFVTVEVLDESGNCIKDASISATLDGNVLCDLEVMLIENDEGKNTCEEFTRGDFLYELFSDEVTSLAKDSNYTDYSAIRKRITVTVSKAGFKTETFSPPDTPNKTVSRTSVSLVRE